MHRKTRRRYAAARSKPSVVQRWRAAGRAKRAGVTGVSLALVGALVAVALTLIRAPIEGEVEVRRLDPEVEWFGTPAAAKVNPSSPHTCAASIDSGALVLSVGNALPGDACDVTGQARTVGDTNETWRVQGLRYTTITAEKFQPMVCRSQVDATGRVIEFRVVVTDAAPGTYPADAEAGLELVPADEYVDSACPKV